MILMFLRIIFINIFHEESILFSEKRIKKNNRVLLKKIKKKKKTVDLTSVDGDLHSALSRYCKSFSEATMHLKPPEIE